MSEITLEEALKGYADNERDIRMCELAIAGGWPSIASVKGLRNECLAMKPVIEKTITGLGGTIPMGEVERLKLELHNTEMALKYQSEENRRVRLELMPILESEDPSEYVEKLRIERDDLRKRLEDANGEIAHLHDTRQDPFDRIEVMQSYIANLEAAAMPGTVSYLKQTHATTWRDQPESHWMRGLWEEVAELCLALGGKHEHDPDFELAQIAAIAINWIEYRKELAKAGE